MGGVPVTDLIAPRSPSAQPAVPHRHRRCRRRRRRRRRMPKNAKKAKKRMEKKSRRRRRSARECLSSAEPRSPPHGKVASRSATRLATRTRSLRLRGQGLVSWAATGPSPVGPPRPSPDRSDARRWRRGLPSSRGRAPATARLLDRHLTSPAAHGLRAESISDCSRASRQPAVASARCEGRSGGRVGLAIGDLEPPASSRSRARGEADLDDRVAAPVGDEGARPLAVGERRLPALDRRHEAAEGEDAGDGGSVGAERHRVAHHRPHREAAEHGPLRARPRSPPRARSCSSASASRAA